MAFACSALRGQNLKYGPCAFTEHGAVMLAAVLNSPVAIDASIQVIREFVQLRAMVAVTRSWRRSWTRRSRDSTSSSVWCSKPSAN